MMCDIRDVFPKAKYIKTDNKQIIDNNDNNISVLVDGKICKYIFKENGFYYSADNEDLARTGLSWIYYHHYDLKDKKTSDNLNYHIDNSWHYIEYNNEIHYELNEESDYHKYYPLLSDKDINSHPQIIEHDPIKRIFKFMFNLKGHINDYEIFDYIEDLDKKIINYLDVIDVDKLIRIITRIKLDIDDIDTIGNYYQSYKDNKLWNAVFENQTVSENFLFNNILKCDVNYIVEKKLYHVAYQSSKEEVEKKLKMLLELYGYKFK